MKKVIVTTSWDDGHQLDWKLSRLLEKYRLKGTFYFPGQSPLKPALEINQIKKIALNHEIGGHGLKHYRLTAVPLKKAEKEIRGSKNYFEDLLNKPVKMFAYPGGLFNQEIKEIVKKEGYLGARTAARFQLNKPKDFFSWGVTNQVYPHPFRKKDKNHWYFSKVLWQPFQENFLGIRKFKLPLGAFFSWSKMMKYLFDYVYENGGLWHCWGHSWEIEKYGLWQDLEKVFKYVSERSNVLYLTNSQTLENCE